MADWEINNSEAEVEKPEAAGKKVAVIGAGPFWFNLCSGFRAKMGHKVTVFEALHTAGGSISVWHTRIPFA